MKAMFAFLTPHGRDDGDPLQSAKAAASWLRQPRDWLRRVDFDANRYLLEIVP